MYLVVGGDSLVGRTLVTRLREHGEAVVATTRRHAEAHGIYLDLAGDPADWHWPEQVQVAFICAGVTRIEACERDPGGSARVNVAGTVALAERLTRAGVFITYLSTNQVFEGSVPHQEADAPYSPTTEYGRQKAEAERRALSLGGSAAVVRFTKIVEPEMPLFVQWRHALEAGKSIRPFDDLVMAPVPVHFCIEVLHRVSSERAEGIFQVSADRDVTYTEAGRHLARRLSVPEELVHGIRSSEAGVNLGPSRAHTTLDSTRLRQAFALPPPGVWEAIDSAIGIPACN